MVDSMSGVVVCENSGGEVNENISIDATLRQYYPSSQKSGQFWVRTPAASQNAKKPWTIEVKLHC
jgi:hypothetical protein